MQSVMCRQIETIKPNQIQLRSGEPVSKASCSISSMSSKSENLAARFIVYLNTVTAKWLSTASLGQSAAARSFNESADRLANLLGHARLRRNKFRREPRKEADEIVSHQDLPIAMFT